MFDDLMLLAKGGFTVYHGPVKKVEEYFAGLGIHVPERVNPPDHFIDILEGMVTPGRNLEVSYRELPIKWMHHNGYKIPSDMMSMSGVALSSMDVVLTNEINPTDVGQDEQSFAGELWQDVKTNVELHRDKIKLNLLFSHDLSNRRIPGLFQQYKYFVSRYIVFYPLMSSNV